MTEAAPCAMAAEVLDANPARAFYARVGYTPVSWSVRVHTLTDPAPKTGSMTARLAVPEDAPSIARFEPAMGLRGRGDWAVSSTPPSIEDAIVASTAAILAAGCADGPRQQETIVAVDSRGVARGAAAFAVHVLEPPFLPTRRALLGRFAMDPASPAAPALSALVDFGRRLAGLRAARHVEITDVPGPRSELYETLIAMGASAWSRVLTKPALPV
jgi:hypothetical protein